MAGRCILLDPKVPVTELHQPINWAQCCLCQKNIREKLNCPIKSFGLDKNAGYESLAEIIPKFDRVGALPSHLSVLCTETLKAPTDLLELFAVNAAKWHKSCRSMYSSRELERKSATFAQKCIVPLLGLLESSATDETSDCSDSCSLPKRMCTRSEIPNTINAMRSSFPVCFFCDLPGSSTNILHEVSTLDVDTKVKSCACDLADSKLLAKLAVGDMVAIEAKYHSNCLAQLYNRRRSLEREQYNALSSDGKCSTNSVNSMVLAQLIAYINEVRTVETIVPVFKLAELKTLYCDRLQQVDPKSSNVSVNSTRLKEKLLEHFPDMRSQNEGRDVLLCFDDGIGSALSRACDSNLDHDALHLSRAAEIVRREMFSESPRWSFNNSVQFSPTCHTCSVPKSLLALVSMILEGPSIDMQSLQQNVPAASTISQLIVYNSVQHKRRNHSRISSTVRHDMKYETPLPLYIGLTVHATTRKKSLIDKLFDVGVSVSYDRVMSVLSDLANGVCHRFEVEKAVCPLNLKSNLFTTAAVDNLDHNPTSTSAHGSFHGTAISLIQHPGPNNSGSDRSCVCINHTEPTRSTYDLPVNYTTVLPVHLLSNEPKMPALSGSLKGSGIHVDCALKDDQSWLDSIWQGWQSNTFDCESVASWSAFHAQKQTLPLPTPSICAMLPLFHEQAHSVSMIRHSMDIIRESVENLNPGQVPVITFDQPLYTLAKLIQWNWPETYGESKFVIMFGGLHVEMAALKALGSFLTGSGWVEAVTEAGIVTSGSAEAMLSASHVRRCRRAHEITAAALHVLQNMAFEKCKAKSVADSCNKSLSFQSWCEAQSVEHKQFAFWSSVKKFEMTVMLFVRSLRESNFDLYVDTLTSLMPWFFALDRTNYARWLSVHIRDMAALSHTHSQIFAEFQCGNFTVHKTCHKFSGISIDQAHEQLNALVKGDGGIVGLTENDSALRRWITAGPEVARLVAEFESHLLSVSASECHHEQQPSIQAAFVNDVSRLVQTFLDFGNPFEDKCDLIVLHSRDIISDSEIVPQKVHDMGQSQYDDFVTNRLVNCSVSLSATLKRNKVSLFVKRKSTVGSRAKDKALASRNDSSLFSRLYIASQIRNSDLDEFFKHENQIFPPALSDAGKLHFGAKSDLLTCLESLSPPLQTRPHVDALVFDGAAIVNMLKPYSACTSFDDYTCMVFVPYIVSRLDNVQRIDVVWDRYVAASLKSFTREKRGSGMKRQVTASAPMPRNWHEFLRVDENKTALFCFLGHKLSQVTTATDKQIIATVDTSVVSTVSDYNISRLKPCTHEEADTRMFLHVADLVQAGHRKVMIRTVDTDVVVLAITMLQKIREMQKEDGKNDEKTTCHELSELWLAFGVGHNIRYISGHELLLTMGPDRSAALPLFHAFTGCDTVSAFVGRGKKTCWEIWNKFPAVTAAFIALSSTPVAVPDSCLGTLERFVVMLYDTTSTCSTVNSARRKLFAQKGKTADNIPPTQDALVQHTRRAVYQAGYVWSQALNPTPTIPTPSDWGWLLIDDAWHPLWMTLPDAASYCPELKRCGCKNGCSTNRCGCFKNNFQCTALCACDGECRK